MNRSVAAPLAFWPQVHAVRLILLLSLASLFGLGAAHPTQAQRPPDASSDRLQRLVQRDLHGSDLRGKDGPMAKVGGRLARLHRAYQQHRKRRPATAFRPSLDLLRVREGRVAVEIIAAGRGRNLLRAARQLGLGDAARAGRLVSGMLPITALDELAALSAVQSARPVLAATVSSLRDARRPAGAGAWVGRTTSQGVAAMRVDVARAETGVDGSGVTVGVLSDSYAANPNALTQPSDDIASGDLPPADRIAVLDDLDEGDGSDEGRAMMQLIYDVAPGVDFAFHTAFKGAANFANGIRDLADAGAQVIVDDIIYFGEPMFQDGPIAQAADDVFARGVAYFSSAGNAARQAYEAPFRDSGQSGAGGSGTLHDFDPGGGTDIRQRLTIPQGQTIRLSFQWTDPYASASSLANVGADTDLDIYLTTPGGNVVAASERANLGGDPVEFIGYTNESRPGERFDLRIRRASGPAPELIRYVYYAPSGVTVDEYATQSATTFGHANAAGAEAVAAVPFYRTPAFGDDTPTVESFSSLGGVPIYFDPDGNRRSEPVVRRKPEITAPDGTNTTFFGGDTGRDEDSFPNFFGTSAAAPHAAAVAALMQAFEERSPARIYADLEGGALDIEAPGFDFRSGYGLVRADLSVPGVPTVFDFQLEDAQPLQVSWEERDDANIASFDIQASYFGGPFCAVKTVEDAGADVEQYSTPLAVSELQADDGCGAFNGEDGTFGDYQFRLAWTSSSGERLTSEVVTQTVRASERRVFVYPNPATSTARIRLVLDETQRVAIALYSASGQRVATLYDRERRADDGRPIRVGSELLGGLASGVYFLRFRGEEFVENRQLVLVR
jgi:hypothetical protein